MAPSPETSYLTASPAHHAPPPWDASLETSSVSPTCPLAVTDLLTTLRSQLLPRAGWRTLTRRRRQSSWRARRTWPSPCLPGEGEPPMLGHTLCLFSFWILLIGVFLLTPLILLCAPRFSPCLSRLLLFPADGLEFAQFRDVRSLHM